MIPDDAHCRLHAAGWSLGEYAVAGPAGLRHVVEGANGENLLRAAADTSAGAWRLSLEQARSLGMLSRTPWRQ